MTSQAQFGKKLAIVATSPQTINAFVRPQLSSLKEEGWNVNVICGEGSINNDVRLLADEVHQFPMHRSIKFFRDFLSLLQMRSVLKQINPDVLVYSTPKASLLSSIAGFVVQIPIRVYQLRGARWEGSTGLQKKLLIFLDRLTLRLSTHVLSVSHSLSNLYLDQKLVPIAPEVLGSGGSKGVDTHVFYPLGEVVSKQDFWVFGSVGRLSKDKGFDQAIAVVNKLNAMGHPSKLEIIGDLDDSQPVGDEVLEEIEKNERVKWSKHLSPIQLARAMRLWDGLIFTSKREGLPNVVIESAASGIPVFAWSVTGVTDAVNDGVTGRLTEYGDVDQMTSRIVEFLSDNDSALEKRREISNWAKNEFSEQKVTSNFINYLGRIRK